MYKLEPCHTSNGFKATLVDGKRLNLKKLKGNFEIQVETPVVYVLKIEGVEVIAHKFGYLQIKNCQYKEIADALAKKVYGVLLA